MHDPAFVGNEYFRCEVTEGIAVITLQKEAFALVTDIAANQAYLDLLEKIDNTQEIKGLIQINDTTFDDVVAFERFLESLIGHAQQSAGQISNLLEKYGNLTSRVRSCFRSFSKPHIAGFNGSMSLEHLGLALLFDLRVVTDNSEGKYSNFRKGFPPSGHLGYLMGHFAGFGRAQDIFISEDTFPATRLKELGLVNEIVSEDQLHSKCREWIDKLSGPAFVGLKATRQVFQYDDDARQKFILNAREVFNSTLVRHLQGNA